uniref:RING-type E3 ubiquitin transferase n=1 Tax=Microcebus murinus TaxID=30608 RepID=A0A8C5V7P2_MICMU
MASELLVNLKEEVTCPICLDLLTEPLSLDCGHSFCQACITANHRKSIIDQQGESSCPVCRITYQLRNLRPNRHVANIVERLRQVRVNPEERQKTDQCARHGEKLLLFCKKDGKVICCLCERSKEHRGHHTCLIEEVAQKYQKVLQEALEKQMKKQQEAEKLKPLFSLSSLKIQIQFDRENIKAQFDKLRRHPRSSSQDVSIGLQSPAIEMLSGVWDSIVVIPRSETLMLKTPKTFPKEQRRVFQAPDLRGMLQVFKELKDVQRYWVYVTLAPSNNSYVVISSDKRQVVPVCNQRYLGIYVIPDHYYGILGFPVIASGKRYWEVDVTQKTAWILGVCVEKACPQNIVKCYNLTGNYQPQYGYWVIGLKNTGEYNAFQDSLPSAPHPPSAPSIVTLSLTVAPNRVGIFLDYEAGTVSFFNVTNHGFLIYKFSTRFACPVHPYFNPMACQVPMTLC